MNDEKDHRNYEIEHHLIKQLKSCDKHELVSLISKIPVALAIFNTDGDLVVGNQLFADIYQSDAMYLINKNLEEFSTTLLSHFQDVIAEFNQNRTLEDIEHEIYSKGHFYQVHFRGLRNNNNQLDSIVVVAVKITRLKRRERVLTQINKKLHDDLYIDHLTGLKNKLALKTFIQDSILNNQLRSYSFIRIDLDENQFSEMNHHFNFKDSFLSEMTTRIEKEILKDQATLYRLSQWSFVVIIECSTHWTVLTIAEKIRLKILLTDYSDNLDLVENIIGWVGVFHPRFTNHLGCSDILQQLDRAIDESKKMGKNAIYVLKES